MSSTIVQTQAPAYLIVNGHCAYFQYLNDDTGEGRCLREEGDVVNIKGGCKNPLGCVRITEMLEGLARRVA